MAGAMLTDLTYRSPAALAFAGVIAPERLPALENVAARYAVAVTSTSLAIMDPSDPADPIAVQFIPSEAELAVSDLERADPVGDRVHSPVPGIVHRYPDRALLMATHACATYCRFCFRREVVGPTGEGGLSPSELDLALGYIRDHGEIWEVILTGGDPLILSPRRLGVIMDALGEIGHVKVVRLHTRVPAVAPSRITQELVAALRRGEQAVYVALHANHPRELTPEARAACGRLIDAGIPMLSQSVLLKGVNDDPETLAALMRAFVESRIKPYYLHHADLAPGTSHLRTPLERGRDLVKSLRGRVSGLCQPTFVLDIPGGFGKVPVGASYVSRSADGTFRLEDPWGQSHDYPPSPI